MSTAVYFSSTTLHLYTAAAIAAERKDEDAYLVIIDQPEDKPCTLHDIVLQWEQSPFTGSYVFNGRHQGICNKVKKRKKMFSELLELIRQLKPEHMFVGNDRRIEFQYAMHASKKLGFNTTGHYMDEGTFTYTGRKASSSFTDKVIDNIAKKVIYGSWWQNPPSVGASAWVDIIHVAFPELIHESLKSKTVEQLNPDAFLSDGIRSLSALIIDAAKFDVSRLNNIDVLITLPHESLFAENRLYKQNINHVIDTLKDEGLVVAVKYHPRGQSLDPLQLEDKASLLLPPQISFEALLPLLPDHCEVWGDISSTLLTSRWLRSALKVISVSDSQPDGNFATLFDKLGIKIKILDDEHTLNKL